LAGVEESRNGFFDLAASGGSAGWNVVVEDDNASREIVSGLLPDHELDFEGELWKEGEGPIFCVVYHDDECNTTYVGKTNKV